MRKTKIVLILLILLTTLSLFMLYLSTGKLIDGKLVCTNEQLEKVKQMLIDYYNTTVKKI